MGATLSRKQEWVLPPKNSHYYLPESEYDNVPVINKEEIPFEVPKFQVTELLTLSKENKGHERRHELFQNIIKEVEEKGFIILTESNEQLAMNKEAQKEVFAFLDTSQHNKDKYTPGDKKVHPGGYNRIFFENRDSLRDPEYRDVYQLFMTNFLNKYPSEKLKNLAHKYFKRQWNIGMAVLRLLAIENDCSLEYLKSLFALPDDYDKGEVTSDAGDEEGDDEWSNLRKESENSDLSFFKYSDTQHYKEEQRCMVHQDKGLVTIIPKSSHPGLHILYEQQWIPIEHLLEENDLIVYFGLAMNWISLEKVRSVFHRVTRLPSLTRYSCPFEIKPNNSALLKPFMSCDDGRKVKSPITFDALVKNVIWLRVQMAVDRTDGIDFTKDIPSRSLVRPFEDIEEEENGNNNNNNSNDVIEAVQ